MRSRVALVTEILVFAAEIPVTGMKIFLYEHSSLVNREEIFLTKKVTLLLKHGGQNVVIFVFQLQK